MSELPYCGGTHVSRPQEQPLGAESGPQTTVPTTTKNWILPTTCMHELRRGPRASDEISVLATPDFSLVSPWAEDSVTLYQDFWSLELWDNKCALRQVHGNLLCGNKKRIHLFSEIAPQHFCLLSTCQEAVTEPTHSGEGFAVWRQCPRICGHISNHRKLTVSASGGMLITQHRGEHWPMLLTSWVNSWGTLQA